MRTAIGAAIITNERLLLVRKRESWILPGGKPKPEEPDLECLCREVREELSGTLLKNLRFYKTFEGRTPHKGDILQAKVFFAEIEGPLYKPAAEINAAEWVRDTRIYNLSDITSKIVDSLRRDGYLPAL